MESNNYRKRRNPFGYFISSFAGVLVGAGLVVALYQSNVLTPKVTTPTVNISQPVASQNEYIVDKTGTSSISSVAKRLMPSVVGITSTTNPTILSRGESGVGSGIIVDEKGYILTNNHVASKTADEIVVSLYDGREVNGKVVWADPSLDLAVVKINADKLTVASLGDSDAQSVGDTAIAIGNPLGLTFQRTVTSGIISALNRTIDDENGSIMEDLIQTDASINPGNSGGPLININGEVIGINTIKVTSAEGMGFAIPINIAKPILKSIEETGKFITPMVGIHGIDKAMASFVSDLKVGKGIFVYDVVDRSPAYGAGLRKGDTILLVNGKEVNTMLAFESELFTTGVGNTATLKIKGKDGKERDISVKLVPRTN